MLKSHEAGGDITTGTPVGTGARDDRAAHPPRALTRKGRLVGIVTTMDMIRALLPSAKRRKPAADPRANTAVCR